MNLRLHILLTLLHCNEMTATKCEKVRRSVSQRYNYVPCNYLLLDACRGDVEIQLT